MLRLALVLVGLLVLAGCQTTQFGVEGNTYYCSANPNMRLQVANDIPFLDGGEEKDSFGTSNYYVFARKNGESIADEVVIIDSVTIRSRRYHWASNRYGDNDVLVNDSVSIGGNIYDHVVMLADGEAGGRYKEFLEERGVTISGGYIQNVFSKLITHKRRMYLVHATRFDETKYFRGKTLSSEERDMLHKAAEDAKASLVYMGSYI